MAELWTVRQEQADFQPDVEYADNPYNFTLEVHHGGKFDNGPGGRTYVSGHVDYIDKVNSEYFSVIILKNMFEHLGYLDEDVVSYQYTLPGEELDGLRPLGSDTDVIELIENIQNTRVIEVYVEHFKTHPRKYLNIKGGNDEVRHEIDEDLNIGLEDYQFSSDEGIIENNLEESDVSEKWSDEGDEEDDFGSDKGSDETDSGSDKGSNDSEEDDSDYIVDEDYLDDALTVDMNDYRAAVEFNLSDEGEPDDEDEVLEEIDLSDEGEHVMLNDNRRYRVNCLGVDPRLIRCESKWVGTKNVGSSKVKAGACSSGTKEVGASKGTLVKAAPKKKDQKPSCHWTLHISNVRQEGTWTVKTYFKDHTCLHTRDINLCTINWLAREIEPIVKSDPTKKPRNILEDLQKKYQIQVTPYQVCRAKAMAEKKVLGDYKAQYGSLRDYIEELVRSNPGTTVKLDVEPCCNPSSPSRQFRRIYICFGALKEGFKLGGRDILGLDGCFMKGPFPGQILTAVGMDANNGIYPLAYSLVEAESTDSWTWFLECLGDDLDLHSNSNFTFISDRQKGIIPALQKVFPSAEHRYCLRHIHENMKPRWRGVVFKNMLEKCAFATTPQEFERSMKAIQDKDTSLYDWLKEIPPKHWSRAYFSVRPRCDVLLNNLCEVFNRQLVLGRDKPVITCLEFIREYLMKRMVVVHIAQDHC